MTTAVSSGPSVEPRVFRRVQRLAHECAEAVAARLAPGVTEREAARMQQGATFEEILVVTGSRDAEESAFGLADDRPHVRRRAEEK